MSKAVLVVLVLLATLGGLILGVWLSRRILRRSKGSAEGIILGFPVTLIVSLTAGHLCGGFGEEALGMTIGVPAGLFFGCAAGAFVTSTIAGLTGVVGLKLLQRS